jgi:hypothetical protein
MAKPIIVVTLRDIPSQELHSQIKDNIKRTINDEYYVFLIFGSETKFEVFYEKDFNEGKYEELKAIIEKEVINAPNKNI